MSKEINIKLSATEALELCGILGALMDVNAVPSPEVPFLRGIANKIEMHLKESCDDDTLTDAIQNIEINDLIKYLPNP